jgi:hypothetical protein
MRRESETKEKEEKQSQGHQCVHSGRTVSEFYCVVLFLSLFHTVYAECVPLLQVP